MLKPPPKFRWNKSPLQILHASWQHIPTWHAWHALQIARPQTSSTLPVHVVAVGLLFGSEIMHKEVIPFFLHSHVTEKIDLMLMCFDVIVRMCASQVWVPWSPPPSGMECSRPVRQSLSTLENTSGKELHICSWIRLACDSWTSRPCFCSSSSCQM